MPSHSSPALGFVARVSGPPCICAAFIPGRATSSQTLKFYGRFENSDIRRYGQSHPNSQQCFPQCVFFVFNHSNVLTQNISTQSVWSPQRRRNKQHCPYLPYESRVMLEAKSSDKLPSRSHNSPTILVTGGKVSKESTVDHREIFEDFYSENEVGTTEASPNESLQQSFDKSLSSVVLERSARSTINEDRDQNHWWTKLKGFVSPRARGIFLFNILTILYGSNVSVIKQTQALLDPATFSAGRFAIASLAFSPFLWRALKVKQLGRAGFELGVLASIGYLTQCIGLVTTEAGHASFISTFTVIVVPILSGISGVKISKITWAAAAVSLLGVGLLESNGAHVSVGDLWSFVSAVFFGIHMLRTEHHSRQLPSDASMPLLSLQLFVIASFSAFWSFWSNANFRAFALNLQAFNSASLSQAMAAVPWHPMLYTGLISTAFPLWIELVSMRDVSATEAAVIYTLEPLWGAGFAWSLLGERWGATGWIGALLILGGSLTVQLFGRVEESPCMAIAVMDLNNSKPNGLLCTEVFTKNLERKAQDILTPKALTGHRRARSKPRSKKF